VLELKGVQEQLKAEEQAAEAGSVEQRDIQANADKVHAKLAEHSTNVLLYGSAEERYARLKDNTRKLAETIRNLANDIQQYTTASSIKLDMASAQIQAIGRAADAAEVMLEMKRSLDVMTESMNVTTQFVSDTQMFFRSNLDTFIKDLETFDETTTGLLEENLKKSREIEDARIKAAIDKAVAQQGSRRSGRRLSAGHPDGVIGVDRRAAHPGAGPARGRALPRSARAGAAGGAPEQRLPGPPAAAEHGRHAARRAAARGLRRALRRRARRAAEPGELHAGAHGPRAGGGLAGADGGARRARGAARRGRGLRPDGGRHAYLERLQRLELAPVDQHRVLLRRHDPASGTAAFRIELTKLDASGVYLRLLIELTQVSSLWRRKVVDLEADGETAAASEGFRAMVYRCADLDAETLFVRLHGVEGVQVERVARGVIGPALFSLPVGGGVAVRRTMEAPDDALGRAWHAWSLGAGAAETERPEMMVAFATDSAAGEVREEKSNDPVSPLLAERLGPQEGERYRALRGRYPFKVFKDRKFVATSGLKAVVQGVCAAAGTRNIVYDLRPA
jgi:hypothetical protein